MHTLAPALLLALLCATAAPVAAQTSQDDREDTTIYIAVVNTEEQYSIWPADRELPLGWTAFGQPGLKADVLAWIEQVWTNRRPGSLPQQMEGGTRGDG